MYEVYIVLIDIAVSERYSHRDLLLYPSVQYRLRTLLELFHSFFSVSQWEALKDVSSDSHPHISV